MKNELVIEEQLVLKLSEIWNKYLTLSYQHPDDVEEFRHALHQLQLLLAIREMRRKFPNLYPTHQKEE